MAGFWKLLKIYIFLVPGRTPGILQIGRERRPRTPDIVEQPKEVVDFEVGVGDRLATLRVSEAKL